MLIQDVSRYTLTLPETSNKVRCLSMDFDDGMEINYPKFGIALKTIPSRADKDE